MGADLVVPKSNIRKKSVLRIKDVHVSKIEKYIDDINDDLPPLKSFILPGGSILSSRLHLARTVCRRCEINILHINNETSINQNVKRYINRLSDLLFVIARSANLVNNKEILWKPGKNLDL